MAEAAAAQPASPKGFGLLKAAFSTRKTGIMLVLGMAAGLPYALLLGTLYAWLGETGVDLETMGVFSLIGLAYAFKFLWSPLVDRLRLPGLWRLGRRRGWPSAISRASASWPAVGRKWGTVSVESAIGTIHPNFRG